MQVLGSEFGSGAAIVRCVPSVPLLTEADWIRAVRPIDRQDAVEVIYLVLDELGSIPVEFDFVNGVSHILVLEANSVGPLDPYQHVGERETVVPHDEIFGANINNLGVDQWPGAVHFDVDDSYWGPDLRGRDGTSGPKPRLPVAEGFAQVVDDHTHRGGARMGNCGALGPENWVAQQADAVDRHGSQYRDSGSNSQVLPRIILEVAITTTNRYSAIIVNE